MMEEGDPEAPEPDTRVEPLEAVVGSCAAMPSGPLAAAALLALLRRRRR
jgi:uncharacterized protein (TIGR03382 family)